MDSSTAIAPAPMIDATMVGRTRSKTRIEGMEQLNTESDLEAKYANMTDAERAMREEELSFYSASDNDHGDDNIWGLLSGVGGNIYEWYVGERLQSRDILFVEVFLKFANSLSS